MVSILGTNAMGDVACLLETRGRLQSPQLHLGLEIGRLAQKIGDLRLDSLCQQGTGSGAQDLGELVVEGAWLNPSRMTLSLGTAYRAFGGEVEASNTPTICRLPEFTTFGDSSTSLLPYFSSDADQLDESLLRERTS